MLSHHPEVPPWTSCTPDECFDALPDFAFAPHFLRGRIAGCAGQPHTTIVGAGHFLQEDRGPELARVVADFVQST